MGITDWISARAVLWWMVLTGFAINYMVRITINIAIVSMVKVRVTSSGGAIIAECSDNDGLDPTLNSGLLNLNILNSSIINSTNEVFNSSFNNTSVFESSSLNLSLLNSNWLNSSLSKDAESFNLNPVFSALKLSQSNDTTQQLEDTRFPWDEREQNWILGAFYWTMWITQIPGGVLAQKFGTKRVYGFSQLASVLLAFAVPLCARAGFQGMMAIRLLQGLFSGFTWPAMHTLIGQWVPPDERSKFVSAYLGSSLGAALTFPGCGLLISWWGWEAVFYATGVLGTAWFVAWWLLVFDTPQQHPRISLKERAYIERSLGRTVQRTKIPTPWRAILTSIPVWINTLAQWGSIWGLFTLLTQAPTYFKFIHGFDIRMTGLLSGLPHLSRIVFALSFSVLADCLLNKKIMSATYLRKFATLVGCVISGLCMLGLALMGCNTTGAIVLLTAATAIGGASASGALACIVDLSPNFAGVVFGIVSAISVFPGFLSPLIVGYLTFENQTSEQWRLVFLIAAGMQVLTGVLFMAFGSAELQSWNSPASSDAADDVVERTEPLVKSSKKRPIVKQ